MTAYKINASNISPWPGFSWWVQAQMNSVLAMVGIKQNLEIKGGPLFVVNRGSPQLTRQVHVLYCNNLNVSK